MKLSRIKDRYARQILRKIMDDKLKAFCEKQQIWDYVDNVRHYYDMLSCSIRIETQDWVIKHPNYAKRFLIDMEDRLYEIYSTDLCRTFRRCSNDEIHCL